MHVSHCGLPLLLLVPSFPDPVASESGVPRVESSQTMLHTSTPYEAESTPNPSPSTVFLSSTAQLGPSTSSPATTVHTSVPQGPVPKSTSIPSSSTLPSAFPHPRSNTFLSATPEIDEGIETLSLTMSTVGSTTSATPPTTMEEETSSGGAAMLELPFMVGIAVGTFLLVMIIVVTVMLFVVVCARRRRDARKLPVSGEIFTNVVTAANPETVFGKAKYIRS